ncbi:S8/S53 family peptidase [Schaalia meyeri]|mgnify:FL=1|uniref:S8 family peptidase n=1 Tax=Schaalia meyeri TaxID=52773 RepID=UPI0020442794|nr:S8/S53 family peptidase [Schaalia meyeri]MCM3899699.1 S8/S53 family peptidase [Schaalia meyeri]
MVTTRAARAARAAACAAALSIATATLPAGPAHAADTITAADQPYYAYYHLDQARAKGYTGQGVTIALLDGEVDTTAPELTGATITDKTPCTITTSLASKRHATAVASILSAPQYGVAPQATLLAYRSPVADDKNAYGDDCHSRNGIAEGHQAALINQAIDDGAEIISISQTSDDYVSAKWALARALNKGVIVVAGAGNEGEDVFATNSLDTLSGVVGVGAITTEGVPTAYSSKGQGVTTAALGGPVLARNYESGQNEPTNGTSMATPMVAGFLALARQKWPDATANQLLQLLTKTALNKEGTWNPYTGYGVASLGAMLNTDPSQYPDENPLADKGEGSSPTPEEVQLYADGLISPSEITSDSSYVYRGLDESQLKAATNSYPTHIGTSPRYHR